MAAGETRSLQVVDRANAVRSLRAAVAHLEIAAVWLEGDLYGSDADELLGQAQALVEGIERHGKAVAS
jgi:hypothetical protein